MMYKNVAIIIIALVALSCSSTSTENKVEENPAAGSTGAVLKPKGPKNEYENKVLGIWTNGETKHATFEIGKDFINYTDQNKDYRYLLQKDSMTILFESYAYTSKISFEEDTLLMTSKNGEVSKFWEFKN
jgi:hypothetical protein